MTINSRPPRNEEEQSDFLNRAATEDTTKLQCWIPSELHHWLKIKAVDGRTNMTALVVEALENYRRERER